jgi:hypothetical protein
MSVTEGLKLQHTSDVNRKGFFKLLDDSHGEDLNMDCAITKITQ